MVAVVGQDAVGGACPQRLQHRRGDQPAVDACRARPSASSCAACASDSVSDSPESRLSSDTSSHGCPASSRSPRGSASRAGASLALAGGSTSSTSAPATVRMLAGIAQDEPVAGRQWQRRAQTQASEPGVDVAGLRRRARDQTPCSPEPT